MSEQFRDFVSKGTDPEGWPSDEVVGVSCMQEFEWDTLHSSVTAKLVVAVLGYPLHAARELINRMRVSGGFCCQLYGARYL
jgi:hypothetical protein